MQASYVLGVTPDSEGRLSQPEPTIEEWADGWWRANFCPEPGTTFVYHLYAIKPFHDASYEAELVYVGITNDLVQRMHAHSKKWWWAAIDLRLSAAFSTPSRRAALDAELSDIQSMHPPINKAGRLAEVVSL